MDTGVESHTAETAWKLLIGGVLAYDWIAPEHQTLSEGVDRALECHPIATTLAIGITALHLLNILPERIDPIHQLASVVRR